MEEKSHRKNQRKLLASKAGSSLHGAKQEARCKSSISCRRSKSKALSSSGPEIRTACGLLRTLLRIPPRDSLSVASILTELHKLHACGEKAQSEQHVTRPNLREWTVISRVAMTIQIVSDWLALDQLRIPFKTIWNDLEWSSAQCCRMFLSAVANPHCPTHMCSRPLQLMLKLSPVFFVTRDIGSKKWVPVGPKTPEAREAPGALPPSVPWAGDELHLTSFFAWNPSCDERKIS